MKVDSRIGSFIDRTTLSPLVVFIFFVLGFLAGFINSDSYSPHLLQPKIGYIKCDTKAAGCALIVNTVVDELQYWDWWASISKLSACVLGAFAAALGVSIASKCLGTCTHYFASAVLAALVYCIGVLNPYQEYKQFRSAYAILETAYLDFSHSDKDSTALRNLTESEHAARQNLQENWAAPRAPCTTNGC